MGNHKNNKHPRAIASNETFETTSSSSSQSDSEQSTSSSSSEPQETTSSSSSSSQSSCSLAAANQSRSKDQTNPKNETIPNNDQYTTNLTGKIGERSNKSPASRIVAEHQKKQATMAGQATTNDVTFTGGSSSSSSTKRYRNSPFGLKNHFLTMPDETSLTNHNELNMSLANDENNLHDLPHNNDGDCISSSEMSEAAVNWQGYKRHHQKHPRKSNQAKQHQLSEYPINSPSKSSRQFQSGAIQTSQPMANRALGSAIDCQLATIGSDAGLDADKCNAKQQQLSFDPYAGATTPTDNLYNPNLLIKTPSSASYCNPNPNLNKLTAHTNQQIKGSPESASLLVRFSSIMYATFLVILGCIFHISELRQKSKNSSDHIYTIIVAALGIVWLLFLQMDLMRYKRFASRYILIGSMFNDHQNAIRRLERNSNSNLGGIRSSNSSSSAASLIHDRLSLNTEVIFKKTAYKMYEHQQQAALGKEARLRKLANQQHRMRTKSISDSPLSEINGSGGLNSGIWLDNQPIDENGQGATNYGLNSIEPAYKFLHGKMGANFYLKCGMAAFCFGHVIHEGLRFGQQLYFFGTANVHCRDSAALIAHLITPLYSFYQLFMMFKYSNLVINRHKTLAKFGLMHIIGTSVAFWFRTIMEEAFEDFVHKMDYFKTNKPELNLLLTARDQQPNSTNTILTLMSSPISDTITPNLIRNLPDSYACAQNTLLTTKSMNALPYLYPFTIEYNLLLASTFLSLYFNIGKVGHKGSSSGSCNYTPDCNLATSIITSHHHQHNKHQQHSVLSHSDNSSSVTKAIDHANDKDLGEYKSNFVVNADCHSANKGLFCGFFVLLVTLVTIVIFFVTINKPSHVQLGIKINLIQEATLTVLILIVTLAGFKQMKKLNRNRYLKEKVTTDDVLMLIPLPFFFIHSLLSFRAETASLISSLSTASSISTIKLDNQRPSSIAIDFANNRIISQDGNDIAMAATGLIGVTNGTLLNGLYQDEFISSGGSRISNNFSDNNNDIDNGSNNNKGNRNSNNNNVSDDNHRIINNKTIEPGGLNSTGNSRRNNGINVGHIESFATTISSISGSRNNNVNTSYINGKRRISRSNKDNVVRVDSKVDVNIGSSTANSDINNGNNSNNSGDSSFNFSQIDHFKLITVALNIIVMIEVLVQTNFIIDGMRRCSESRYLRFKKPGRELITFAILLNITYWIVATFETKSVEQYKTEIEYYGPLPYMFISHTTLPVMLFYRYHSSVCLTEIWNRAYKLPKEH